MKTMTFLVFSFSFFEENNDLSKLSMIRVNLAHRGQVLFLLLFFGCFMNWRTNFYCEAWSFFEVSWSSPHLPDMVCSLLRMLRGFTQTLSLTLNFTRTLSFFDVEFLKRSNTFTTFSQYFHSKSYVVICYWF